MILFWICIFLGMVLCVSRSLLGRCMAIVCLIGCYVCLAMMDSIWPFTRP